MKRISKKQQQALEYYKEQFRVPTLEEIGKEIGVSKQRASILMKELEKKGKLRLDKKRIVYFV